MEALKYKTIVMNDGEISLTGVPCKKGQEVEMILLIDSTENSKKQFDPDDYIGILNIDQENIDEELKTVRNEWDRF